MLQGEGPSPKAAERIVRHGKGEQNEREARPCPPPRQSGYFCFGCAGCFAGLKLDPLALLILRRPRKAGFAVERASVRIKGSVLQLFRAKFPAATNSLVGKTMALKCELCGKGPHFGNVISHANNTRRRRWNPNLKRVHALVDGARKHVRVCTACIRAGRVKKAA
jgi:large subunit ribosomal protein L28